MKYTIITTLILLALFFTPHLWRGAEVRSQNNVGININGNAPNSSAMLDVESNNKGIFIPRVALTATNSGSPITPAPGGGEAGLMIYNTASVNDVIPGFYYWNGSKWIQFLTTGNSGGLGAWTNLSDNIVYQAATDGFVVARRHNLQYGSAVGYTDSSNPPTTIVAQESGYNGEDVGNITFPVKKGDYWSTSGCTYVRWIPFGN